MTRTTEACIPTTLPDALRVISELEAAVEVLKHDLASALDDVEDAKRPYETAQARLREAADLLTKQGLLVDTPAYKWRWIETGEGLLRETAAAGVA